MEFGKAKVRMLRLTDGKVLNIFEADMTSVLNFISVNKGYSVALVAQHPALSTA